MSKIEKLESQRAKLESMLGNLKDADNLVIVEGFHDRENLSKLGVLVITYDEFMHDSEKFIGFMLRKNSNMYIIMDKDKGGKDKETKIKQKLTDLVYLLREDEDFESARIIEKRSGLNFGRKFLSMLNSDAAEQVVKEANSLLSPKVRADCKRIEYYDGENVERNFK